jgi:hypothetical protein
MKCRFCDSNNIHTSRWQGLDIFMLPLLCLPMRCHDCIKRDHRSLFKVLRIRSEERARRRKQDLEADSANRNDALQSEKP